MNDVEKKTKTLLSWSGGKDSALCLYELQTNREYLVSALITTLTKDYDRISMHGVRRDLLLAQSKSIDIPLREVWISSKATNEIYQVKMAKTLVETAEKYETKRVAFGDLFLSDIREYREEFLRELGFTSIFPLWKKDTRKLAENFVKTGFRAIICTVDPKQLDPKFCGRSFDENLLSEIPPGVDPCGENGEFHTFVYGGPIFKQELQVRVGETVIRDGFYFTDIIS